MKSGTAWVTLDEAAEAFGVSPSTVSEQAKLGVLPSIELGTRRLIPRAVVYPGEPAAPVSLSRRRQDEAVLDVDDLTARLEAALAGAAALVAEVRERSRAAAGLVLRREAAATADGRKTG